MPTNLDETELARLEALACAAGTGDYSAHDDADDSAKYAAAACNAVPALVAEVRRLREELNTFIEEDQSRVILVQQQMLDVMREKVEAWAWWDEVAELNEDQFWCSFLSRCAVNEMCDTYLAAREAVHADR